MMETTNLEEVCQLYHGTYYHSILDEWQKFNEGDIGTLLGNETVLSEMHPNLE